MWIMENEPFSDLAPIPRKLSEQGLVFLLCKINESEIRRISFFVLAKIWRKFTTKFRLAEISPDQKFACTKFRQNEKRSENGRIVMRPVITYTLAVITYSEVFK